MNPLTIILLRISPIHINNLIQRAHNNLGMKNPLTAEIKTSYPLIYDMAVFLTSEICSIEKITINEDEITYIAFYIGAYLEKKKKRSNKITSTFVYAKYNDIHLANLSYLQNTLHEDLEIVKIVPINEIDKTDIDYRHRNLYCR